MTQIRKTPQYLENFSGDNMQITQTVRDRTGAAKDLTAATITFNLVKETGASVEFTKTVGSGITLLAQSGITLGQFTIDIDPTDTANLDGRYRHETQVTDSSGNVATTAYGPFQIYRDAVE